MYIYFLMQILASRLKNHCRNSHHLVSLCTWIIKVKERNWKSSDGGTKFGRNCSKLPIYYWCHYLHAIPSSRRHVSSPFVSSISHCSFIHGILSSTQDECSSPSSSSVCDVNACECIPDVGNQSELYFSQNGIYKSYNQYLFIHSTLSLPQLFGMNTTLISNKNLSNIKSTTYVTRSPNF